MRRRDAGGPLEVVTDGATGLVVSPDAGELARAAGWLREHRDDAATLGRAGHAVAAEVTWDRASGRLLAGAARARPPRSPLVALSHKVVVCHHKGRTDESRVLLA